MSDYLIETIKGLTDNSLIIVLIMSALPLIELRGAIPAAAMLGVDPWIALIVAWGGAGMAVPVVIAVMKPILTRAKQSKQFGKISKKIEKSFLSKADKKLAAKSSQMSKILAIFGFVALPLPMTGVWSGSIIAAFSGVSFAKSVTAVLAGNFCAAAMLTLICTCFNDYVAEILNAILIITIVALIGYLIIKVVNKVKKAKA